MNGWSSRPGGEGWDDEPAWVYEVTWEWEPLPGQRYPGDPGRRKAVHTPVYEASRGQSSGTAPVSSVPEGGAAQGFGRVPAEDPQRYGGRSASRGTPRTTPRGIGRTGSSSGRRRFTGVGRLRPCRSTLGGRPGRRRFRRLGGRSRGPGVGGRRSSRSSLSSPGIGTGAGLGRFRRLGSVVLGLGSSLGLGVGLRFPVDRKALVGRRVPVFRLGSRGLVFRLGRIRLRDSSSSGSVGFRRSMSSSVRLSRVGPFPSVAGRSRAGLRALPSTAGRSRVGLRALLSTGAAAGCASAWWAAAAGATGSAGLWARGWASAGFAWWADLWECAAGSLGGVPESGGA